MGGSVHQEGRPRAAPIFSHSIERKAKNKMTPRLPQFSRGHFFFASRSTDCEKIGAAPSLSGASPLMLPAGLC